MADEQTWPRVTDPPGSRDVVQILVPEHMARLFERELLTPIGFELTPPMRFSEDDVPTYIFTPSRPR
jgi:hypothetical protein